jgi:acetoacetyl-CoA synthetase
MGSAELYRAVLTLPEVVDALVVDLPGVEGVDVMPMFVVLADGVTLDDGLVDRIRGTIRREVSPRHVPDRIFAVPELPRTLTGKTLEIPVKRLLQGAEIDRVASRDSLANPAALEWFEQSRKAILDDLRPSGAGQAS